MRVCVYVCMYVCLFVCLSVCLSACLLACLLVYNEIPYLHGSPTYEISSCTPKIRQAFCRKHVCTLATPAKDKEVFSGCCRWCLLHISTFPNFLSFWSLPYTWMISKAKGSPSDPRNFGIDPTFQVHPIVSQSKIAVHALLPPPTAEDPAK